MRRMGIACTIALMFVGGLIAPSAHAAPPCFGQFVTIVGTDGDDTIEGTPGRDVIWAGGGDDTVYGRGGMDFICAGSGDGDLLYGNKGNDRIDAGTSERANRVYGGKGDDYLYDRPGGGDGQEMFGGPGNDVLEAGDSNGTYLDVLDGGPGNDVMRQEGEEGIFHAGPGDDVMSGGFGGGDYDTLLLTSAPGPIEVDMRDGTMRGWGNDEVSEIEILMGSRFDDTFVGDEDRNVFVGGAGDDTLSGGAGRDCLTGGEVEFFGGCFSAYRIEARSGDDRLSGGDGDDEMSGGDGNDEITGDEGFDTVGFGAATAGVEVDLGAGTATGEGSDTLDVEGVVGSPFADSLTGSDGSDFLHGGGGTGDVIRGMSGDDTLGAQRDSVLDGGAGSDTATYSRTYFTADTITNVDLRTDSDSLGNTLTDVENVYGTGHITMTIHGDDGPNVLTGSGGDDEIYGYDGDDHLDGAYGDDFLDGGPGHDTLDGGAEEAGSHDTCVNGETVTNCET